MYPNRQYLQTGDAFNVIDTHCHLDFEPLFSNLGTVLMEAAQAGISACIVPGVHPDHWQRIAEIAGEKAAVRIYPAYGVHPMHADLVDDALLGTLGQIAGSGIALGEIGLDPTCGVPLPVQEQAFRCQLRLAVKIGLPVLVHCRRLFQRTLHIIREEKAHQVGGIMHAFSGSPEMAREFIKLGFLISISGVVTWQGALRPVRLAREIPLDSLVLETDAPDLAPQAMRGTANRPALMRDTAIALARIRGTLVTEVADATVRNTMRMFGINVKI